MNTSLPLQTCRILIVEDDFYLAEDLADGLRNAGAEIIGPVASVEAALALLADHRPDLVVLDINLGQETSFELGRRLLADGVPFIFATGYDISVIPRDLSSVAYLIKPVSLRSVISVLVRLRC